MLAHAAGNQLLSHSGCSSYNSMWGALPAAPAPAPAPAPTPGSLRPASRPRRASADTSLIGVGSAAPLRPAVRFAHAIRIMRVRAASVALPTWGVMVMLGHFSKG